MVRLLLRHARLRGVRSRTARPRRSRNRLPERQLERPPPDRLRRDARPRGRLEPRAQCLPRRFARGRQGDDRTGERGRSREERRAPDPRQRDLRLLRRSGGQRNRGLLRYALARAAAPGPGLGPVEERRRRAGMGRGRVPGRRPASCQWNNTGPSGRRPSARFEGEADERTHLPPPVHARDRHLRQQGRR